MTSKSEETILVPVDVAEGTHCWNMGFGEHSRCCQYFDNEGGHGRCTLGLGWYLPTPKRTDVGYPKAKECLALSHQP